MANLIPSGIDSVTGQHKPVTSSDALVDSSGNPLTSSGSSPIILNTETTTANTTNTALIETFFTYQLPANTVSANGYSLKIITYGRNGTAISPLFIQVLINGQFIAEASTNADDSWLVDINLVRQSSTTAKSVGLRGSSVNNYITTDPGAASGGDPNTTVSSLDFTSNQDIVVRGVRPGSNIPVGLTCDQLQVILYPTP